MTLETSADSGDNALVKKSPEAFRTISEVSDVLDVPPHVLRFWETRFNQVKPVKRGGGRRYYRPQDVQLLQGIRGLLYVDGMTIKGVQKILREKGPKHVIALVSTAIDEEHASSSTPVEAEPTFTAGISPVQTKDVIVEAGMPEIEREDLFEDIRVSTDVESDPFHEPVAAGISDRQRRKGRLKAVLGELEALRAVMLNDGR